MEKESIAVRPMQLCHVTEKDLEEFFHAISDNRKEYAVTPDSFFSKKQLNGITGCDICTFAVIQLYELSVRVFTLQRIMIFLKRALEKFQNNQGRGSGVYWKNRHERLRALIFC